MLLPLRWQDARDYWESAEELCNFNGDFAIAVIFGERPDKIVVLHSLLLGPEMCP